MEELRVNLFVVAMHFGAVFLSHLPCCLVTLASVRGAIVNHFMMFSWEVLAL